jgi:hypothetical protein
MIQKKTSLCQETTILKIDLYFSGQNLGQCDCDKISGIN